MVTDSRFDTSQWQTEQASTSALPPDDTKPEAEDDNDFEEEEEDQDEVEDENDLLENEDEEHGNSRVVQPLTKVELEAYKRKQRKRGIIYISSIPHGMTPPKVRHLLSGFGEIERIYLHDGTQGKFGSSSSNSEGKKRKSSAHFTEGWVEFSKKSVAKQVAEILNAQPVGKALVAAGAKVPRGGSSSSKDSGGARRWKDYVWTMKYLPGFKWNRLTEQMAAERASRTARLRTELAQSALEQKDYLAKVERARIMREKQAKKNKNNSNKSKAGEEDVGPGSQAHAFVQQAAASDSTGQRDGSRVRTFKQRAPLLTDVRDRAAKRKNEAGDESKTSSDNGSGKKRKKGESDGGAEDSKKQKQALDSVLGSIF